MTPLSPELVLVAPPDVAARARAELPPYPPFPALPYEDPQSAAPHGIRFDRAFAAFCLVCVAATLTPFALALALGR